MRRLFFVLLVAVLTQSAYSQRNPSNLLEYDMKRFRFGFYMGMNMATFTSVPNPNLNPFDSLMVVEPSLRGGFDVGISVNLRLNPHFDLKFVPSISMLSRTMDYTISYSGDQFTQSKSIESINVDLPFFVKMKSDRIGGNLRFYVLSGGQYCFDMMSNSKKRNAFDEKILKLKASDLQALVGAGLEFYLPYFKVSIEGRMGYGLVDILSKEQNLVSASIDRLHSKTFHLSIILE